MTRDPWDGILDEGETILWQGRPDGRLKLGVANWAGVGFGAMFAGFAAVWMMLASLGGGYFWTFGLIHFSVGIGIAGSALFWPTWRRRHTWYTLTDRRAFIATDIPLQGRKLSSYPIAADTRLKLVDGALPSIHFATELRQTKNGTRKTDIGFERIAEAGTVHALMRQIQTGDLPR